MFDSVPPNLPVEPTTPPPAPASSPVAPPATPLMMPAQPLAPSSTGKKEPEDIFSGLDQSSGAMKSGTPSLETAPPRRGFPTKLVVIIGVVVVLLAAAWGGVYYFVLRPMSTSTPQMTVPSAAPAPTQPVGIPPTNQAATTEQPPAASQPTQVEVPPVAATTPSEPAPVTQPAAGINVPPPTPIATEPTVVTEGKDTDSDQLTDVEEPYYNADPNKADTDGDGFLDGSEVLNLYDPSVKSGLLENATFMTRLEWSGFSVLLPKPWSILPEAGQDTLAHIATGSATRFDLQIISNPQKLSFENLLASQGISAPHAFQTKQGYEAMQTDDGLKTYIAMGDKVLQVTYDLSGDPSYDYRTSYAMVIQSLKMSPSR